MIYALISAALATAVLGGIFYSFSTFVMRGLGDAPLQSGMTAMQEINKRVYGSGFLRLFSLMALASVLLFGWGLYQVQTWAMVGAVVYLGGVIAMTVFVHVPMNKRLDRGMAAAGYWPDYHARWTRLNHIRSASCFASSLAFVAAALALAA